jgi:hypothetical protein
MNVSALPPGSVVYMPWTPAIQDQPQHKYAYKDLLNRNYWYNMDLIDRRCDAIEEEISNVGESAHSHSPSWSI